MGYMLLLENGSTVLLESGDALLIELDSVDVQPYTLTIGAPFTAWKADSPFTAWKTGAVTPMQQSSLSENYVKVPVSATDSGASVNISTGTVTMAFTAVDTEPVSGDWKTATWETDATRSPARYYARCLVGPGGTVTLTDGDYDVWVKVTGVGSEIPVQKAGRITVS